MRINLYVASATGLSRRAADKLIANGKVLINDRAASPGEQVSESDVIILDGKLLKPVLEYTTIILNKPVGYVCSRDGQGSKTIYDLLPPELHDLKPVGRLDKDSSGLLLMSSNGQLAHQLTHPSFNKQKIYEIKIDKPLDSSDRKKIEVGVGLEDGLSRLKIEGSATSWTVTLSEGRNRQIRRTFAALGYQVIKLHRTTFGPYKIENFEIGQYQIIKRK